MSDSIQLTPINCYSCNELIGFFQTEGTLAISHIDYIHENFICKECSKDILT